MDEGPNLTETRPRIPSTSSRFWTRRPSVFPPCPRSPPSELSMALFGRKKSTVGLDIGSGLIKVAVIDHSRSEPELVRVSVVPLLADAIVEGGIIDPGTTAQPIRAP